MTMRTKKRMLEEGQEEGKLAKIGYSIGQVMDDDAA